jgi:glucose-1-phosphate adenylyltransferase
VFTRSRSRWCHDALALVLAGGLGRRLYPLTQDQTKGAVPFAGRYRLIDFTLSNCLHSGLNRIAVLAQYQFSSLERHLRLGWDLFRSERGGCLDIALPQGNGSGGYKGTADAVYQNLCRLGPQGPRHVVVLASDHVYRMDYGALLDCHVRCCAELTIACSEVEREEARRFGVVDVDAARRIVGLVEKPEYPRELVSRPGFALASMGIYVFDTQVLIDVLRADASHPGSTHDFGRDVIPEMISRGRAVRAYNVQEKVGRSFYWRDIGTIDAYWKASMELLPATPLFDPCAPDWPVHTFRPDPPAAPVLRVNGSGPQITDALLCPGVQVTDARVERSVLSPGVRVDPEAEVVESVLLEGVHVGAGSRVYRAIVDQGVHIPANYGIGGSPPYRGGDLHVSPEGITVVPKAAALGRHSDAVAAYACVG